MQNLNGAKGKGTKNIAQETRMETQNIAATPDEERNIL